MKAPAERFGDFPKSRRARIRAEDVGLPGGGQRRVSGLRREELAELAGVSIDCITRLEQGRARTASRTVLKALARALRLCPKEPRAGELARLWSPPTQPSSSPASALPVPSKAHIRSPAVAPSPVAAPL
ncbi:hypothetical protein DMH25_45860 [Streptomyces sp. WAC 01325]|nr:hypothetical protein DMH25_45860 [Streptomyces sp. WAC 01325]